MVSVNTLRLGMGAAVGLAGLDDFNPVRGSTGSRRFPFPAGRKLDPVHILDSPIQPDAHRDLLDQRGTTPLALGQ